MQKSKTKLPRWADLVMMEDGPPKPTEPEPEPPSEEENPEVADKETTDGPVSDMDWLTSKMAAAKGGEGKVFFQEDEKKSSPPKDTEPEVVVRALNFLISSILKNRRKLKSPRPTKLLKLSSRLLVFSCVT
jgi:hypothetical protein